MHVCHVATRSAFAHREHECVPENEEHLIQALLFGDPPRCRNVLDRIVRGTDELTKLVELLLALRPNRPQLDAQWLLLLGCAEQV